MNITVVQKREQTLLLAAYDLYGPLLGSIFKKVNFLSIRQYTMRLGSKTTSIEWPYEGTNNFQY
jgi:hypothetical protein